MKKELSKTYVPAEFEDRIYKMWENGHYFHAEIDKNKKPYTIVIPPPNITGQLHMGHALDETLQDILIRYKRMQGFSTLWIPGTDHASIATEAKIVKAMKDEGLSKADVGHQGFLDRAWDWKNKYEGRIIAQLKKLGSSCDWERLRFTLDDGCSTAVQKVFIDLYNEGLIYHGTRIINWCPNCMTSISDIECEYEEQNGNFWHINYPLADGSGYVEIATTRPETLLGDTAIAVNPKDERYKSIWGKMVKLPLTDREIPIITDEYVDIEFGTGVVKITPAHDPNDFEVGNRHNLPIINIMTDDAHINENGGKYAGMERYEARKSVVEDLTKLGLLVSVEPHVHNVGCCQRCGTTVEPRASLQWFVKMETLAKPAIEAVKDGSIKFVPEHFENGYFHWMENIRDWCISRQLWWGHRIPAYYCQNPSCKYEAISAEKIETCPHCGSPMVQDDDTLDTWFSSALWPFSTLGWPYKTDDFDYFYPTNTLVTGYDIIPFWVARMIFSGLKYTKKAPFDTVLLHGMVRDDKGRKMSKSLGNGVDPLDIIAKFGADALRLTLVSGNAPGSDMRWMEEKVTTSRNFANKLWNAARYVLMNLPDDMEKSSLPAHLSIEDKWVLHLYNELVKSVTDNLDHFELGIAEQNIYNFIWDIYCDWYIELTKTRLKQGGETASAAQNILVFVLKNVLKLLHPFMPYITEEIWQSMPVADETSSIMVAKWCQYNDSLCFEEEANSFTKVIEAIKSVRLKRLELDVPPSKKVTMIIETADLKLFEDSIPFFVKLCGGNNITITNKADVDLSKAVSAISANACIIMPLGELVDTEKELERLQKEKVSVQKDIDFSSKKLNNQGYMAKAPKEQITAEQVKLSKATEKMHNIEKSIAALKQ